MLKKKKRKKEEKEEKQLRDADEIVLEIEQNIDTALALVFGVQDQDQDLFFVKLYLDNESNPIVTLINTPFFFWFKIL